jgi:succinoglycan biosynthesis protein ExoM
MTSPAPVVVVAALTRERLADLARLLRSLPGLTHPVGWNVQFMIIDNDPSRSAEPLVQAAESAVDGLLTYISEPQPGIPAARNRALREAITRGWDLLAFIDDDETPDRHWLSELVAHYEKTGAALIGGPYWTAPPEPSCSCWEQFLTKSIQARSRLIAWNFARLQRAGRYFVISSGNWLGDVNWLSKNRISFDEKYRVSGGSDAALVFVVSKCGGKTSWCPTAIIYEHLPTDRILVRAQLSRYYQQAIVMAGLRHWPASRIIPVHLTRLFVGLALMVVPIRSTFMVGVYLVGWSAGMLGSVCGARSLLYRR